MKKIKLNKFELKVILYLIFINKSIHILSV